MRGSRSAAVEPSLSAPRPTLTSSIYGSTVSRMKTTFDIPDELMVRAKKLHFRGRDCTEDDIKKVYERYGPQRALVAWFDLNRDYYTEWPPRWQAPITVAGAAS